MVVANHLLITGPSRGGKSEWAEQRIREMAGLTGITYLATGPTLPDDAAWQQRLNRHRQRRPEHWRLLEASSISAVSQLLQQGSDCQEDFVLLDSLGGLVASALELEEESWLELQAAFVMALEKRPTPVVLVAEEVGWGVVPPTAIGGRFRDRNGSLTRQCEQHCSESWLVAAGRALPLHQLAQRLNPAP
jgi:adenosylcobinamide kinase/adenosylcobinamide-phosphate guanylyltransferase